MPTVLHCFTPKRCHSASVPQVSLVCAFGDPASTALSCLPGLRVQIGCSSRAVVFLSVELSGISSSNMNRSTVDYLRDMPHCQGFSSVGFFSSGAQVQFWHLVPASIIKQGNMLSQSISCGAGILHESFRAMKTPHLL